MLGDRRISIHESVHVVWVGKELGKGGSKTNLRLFRHLLPLRIVLRLMDTHFHWVLQRNSMFEL